MPELYPSTLQQNFSRGSFNRIPGNNTVSTNMETGPAKKRRRTTLRRDKISGNIILKTLTEYNDFNTWYTSTLQDGIKDFYFLEPATQNQITVSFMENGMQLSDVGHDTYAVKMVLEVVSE